MLRKKILSLILVLFVFAPEVFASHYMGGEITWECLPNGNYRFIMKAYRECGDYAATFSNPSTLETNAPCGNIQMYLYPDGAAGKTDMSPICNNNPSFPHITCDPNIPSNSGGLEEWYFTSDQSYPNGVTINGVPGASGWYFGYQSCCRNPCTNIPNSTSLNWYLRAMMYSYNGQNTYPCWDNSPVFLEKPSSVLCSGYPFTYNPNATDKELDSLSYEWAQPLDGALSSPITNYNPNYSYTSPLPGPLTNPQNVAASINPITGEISFTSYTQGAFVTVNKVTAWKCGIKIAEIFREMQVVILPCGTNLPPVVSAPFTNPVTLLPEYIDTVYAGATVEFSMTAEDYDMLNNGSDFQTISIQASGNQFGQFYTNPNFGCLNPPCATLDPPPPLAGLMYTATNFRWKTTCDHLQTSTGCGGLTNVYNFILKVIDDYCPAPGINVSSITVVLKNPVMLPPRPRCTEVLPDGSVTLHWLIPDTSEIPNSFNSYFIYAADNLGGPYTLIDSIFDLNTTSYTHIGANAQNGVKYYYMRTRSGCFAKYYSANSDIINTINLDVQNIAQVANLSWNAPQTPLFPTSTGWYTIERQGPGGTWVPVNSTQALQFAEVVSGCGYVAFRVTIEDSSGCLTVSSMDSALFQSAGPPTTHCISVEPNGAITLSYNAPVDPNSQNYFSKYLFYASNNLAGPYSLIDSSATYSSGGYTINSINGNNQSYYIYMINRIDCDGYFESGPTDTLSSILLNVTVLDPIINKLEWNAIHTPQLATSTGIYNIYRNYPSGSWVKIKSTTELSAYDTLIICGDSIPYRIEMEDNTDCKSVSNVRKGYYYDNTFPATPVLDTISIDTITGFVNISWLPVADPEVKYIFIYYDNNGIWSILDTVMSNTITSFVDNISPGNNCDISKTYILAAADSCWKTSSMGVTDAHNTIHLDILGLDPCADQVYLSWTPYRNMDTIGGYHIYYSVNGSPYSLLATLYPQFPGQAPPTQYTHQGLTKDTYYCYVIEAFNTDSTKTSTSCSAGVFVTKPSPPDFTYLRNVSVENNEKVHIKLYVDTAALVLNYKLYRAEERVGPYELIAEIPPSTSPEIDYYDYTNSVTDRSLYYYFKVLDSCGTDVMHSDTSRTIFLSVRPDNIRFTNNLSWNTYEGWNWAFIKSYNIFRSVDGLSDPIPIATVPSTDTVYIDEVKMYTETQGKFRYYIEAQQGPGIPDFGDTTFSNYAYDVQKSKINIPNAFSPKGYNNIFRPISAFVDKESFVFVIWNRMGEELFRTTDPYEGWDGKYKGEYVPVGVYIYYVKFITSEGEVFQKRSSVTVIK